MATRLETLLLLTGCILFTGCDTADEGPFDAADDSFFAGGKADGGIEEGSADALAVLALVNDASFEQLDDSDEVGLDARAAAGIYEHRVGGDGVENTDDDAPFVTLAELDAVPYVGSIAFSKLLAYALANGYDVQPDPEPAGPTSEEIDLGVLTLANTADEGVLDVDVGLDARAARNIWAHRVGEDGELGTDDDGYFRTIDELDAIAYVGKAALTAMRTHALDFGYVNPDPYSEFFCARAPLSRDEAIGYLALGENLGTSIPIETRGVRTRERTCGPTGCGEWRNSTRDLEGHIRATSLGHTWYPSVDMTQAELLAGMGLRLNSNDVTMYSPGTRRHRVYYPSTGRFAWDTTVTLWAEVDYDSVDGAAYFASNLDIDGETSFRASDGCFQMRNLVTSGNLEVLTVAYGTF